MQEAVQDGQDQQQQQQQQQQQRPGWTTFDKNSDTKTLINTHVTGKIPKWLSGNLYRNGSGVFKIGDQQLEHLFDGFAVIHRFLIRDGVVSYQSRILDTDTWVQSCKANRLVSSQFATYAHPDPCKSLLDKMMSYLLPINTDNITDNTAVNVVEHGDKLYAITDGTVLNEIDPETLQKKSKADLRDTIAVHIATAHPHFGADGTMYNLATSFMPSAAYGIVAIPPNKPERGTDEDAFKKASLLTTIPPRFKMHVSYSHSFGMTEDYFVVLEQPIAVNMVKLLTINWRREGFANCFSKFPEEKMVFYVIRRSDNQRLPVTFEADPGFCFHFVNCFEVEEHLVLDTCCYDDVNVIDDLCLKNMLDRDYKVKVPPSTFRRFVLPINVTEADPDVNLVNVPEVKATARMLTPGVIYCSPDFITDDKIRMEMPRISYERCNGKKYRYAYGISVHPNEQKLVKVDVTQRKAVYWREIDCSPGEPIFVPRPGAKDEDDGVVLSAVLSEVPEKSSFLLVLDAHSFKELGRATTPSHIKIAMSFHGSFVPGTHT